MRSKIGSDSRNDIEFQIVITDMSSSMHLVLSSTKMPNSGRGCQIVPEYYKFMLLIYTAYDAFISSLIPMQMPLECKLSISIHSNRTFLLDFLKDVGTNSKKKSSSGGGLGSLSSMSKQKKSSSVRNKTCKSKQTPISSIFDTFSSKTPAEKEKPAEQPKSLMSSIFESVKKSSSDPKEVEKEEETDESKMKITKVFDFAGEAVE